MEVVLWMILKPLLGTVGTIAFTWLCHKGAAYFTAKTGIAISDEQMATAVNVVKQVEELVCSGQLSASGQGKATAAVGLLMKDIPGLSLNMATDLIQKAVGVEPTVGATAVTKPCKPAPADDSEAGAIAHVVADDQPSSVVG